MRATETKTGSTTEAVSEEVEPEKEKLIPIYDVETPSFGSLRIFGGILANARQALHSGVTNTNSNSRSQLLSSFGRAIAFGRQAIPVFRPERSH